MLRQTREPARDREGAMTTDEMSEIITNASARIDYLIGRVNALSKERDALLAILKAAAEDDVVQWHDGSLLKAARRAIAKAEGRR